MKRVASGVIVITMTVTMVIAMLIAASVGIGARDVAEAMKKRALRRKR